MYCEKNLRTAAFDIRRNTVNQWKCRYDDSVETQTKYLTPCCDFLPTKSIVMATATEPDISSLVAPISEDNPTGIDLREDEDSTLYYDIKDASNSARRRERQAEIDSEPGTNYYQDMESLDSWKEVIGYAEDILTNHSKDLEAVAYYIQALLRHEGFSGLRKGLLVAHKLVEDFWDGIYPLPDESMGVDGLEETVLHLNHLNQNKTLSEPIRWVPLTDRGPQGGLYGSIMYRESLKDGGIIDAEKFKDAFDATSNSFYIKLSEDVQGCEDITKQLADLLYEKCDEKGASYFAPQMNEVLGALEDVRLDLKELMEKKGISDAPAADPAMEAADSGNGDPAMMQAGMVAGGGGGQMINVPGGTIAAPVGVVVTLASPAITSRDQAFAVLEKVAEYFEKTEPQSLIPAQCRQIVKRGKMSVEDYYQAMIEDYSVLQQLFKQVGLEPPEQTY